MPVTGFLLSAIIFSFLPGRIGLPGWLSKLAFRIGLSGRPFQSACQTDRPYSRRSGPAVKSVPILHFFPASRKRRAAFSRENRNSSAFGRTVTASGHSNRFAMGRTQASSPRSRRFRSIISSIFSRYSGSSFTFSHRSMRPSGWTALEMVPAPMAMMDCFSSMIRILYSP